MLRTVRFLFLSPTREKGSASNDDAPSRDPEIRHVDADGKWQIASVSGGPSAAGAAGLGEILPVKPAHPNG
jgi:hypothetical protein